MCKNCKSKPVYEFTNQRKLCKNCFIEWFQKKVLYTIRKFGMIQQKDIIGYSLSNSFRDVVLEDVLKMFVGKADVELVKLPTKKKTDKIAVSSTLDFGANEIINVIIKGDAKKLNVRPVDGKIIKPLYLFLDKEVLLYVKIKKLKFKKDKKKMSEISKFIDELEIKHPEVKRAIVNGWLKVCN